MVKAEPTPGNLRVLRHGFNSRNAVLLGPDGERYLLPILTKIKLLTLDDRGLLLTGIEIYPPRGSKGSGPMFKQTWWCVLRDPPVPQPAPLADPFALQRLREAAEIGRTKSTLDRRRR